MSKREWKLLIQNGSPLIAKIPTQETIEALEDAISRKNLESSDNTNELFKELGI